MSANAIARRRDNSARSCALGCLPAASRLCKQYFRIFSPNTGMIFVVISHLSRTEPTQLPWLLPTWTEMPVELARSGIPIEPNHVYVIPPGQELTVKDGYFGVRPRSKAKGWSNVITLFLDSLVLSRKPAGVAVILSGCDSDGAAALRNFSGKGGITIAQELTSAYR